MRKVRVAVVGLNRGSLLAKFIIRHAKSLDLVAVADLDKKKADDFAREFKIPTVYYSLDEVLKSDVEAVVLATPIPDHAEHTIKALEAGKHVLCEVICATTIEDCQRIADAIKKSGKKYMMEENYCYYRPLTIVDNMIKDGLLGDVYYAESDYLMDFQMRPLFPHLGTWRDDVYFGRRGHPYITHTLGPLCFLMDSDIKKVSCLGAGKYGDLVADRTCVLMLETNNGGLIRLRNSFIGTRPDLYTYYQLQGTKGCYKGSVGATDTHKLHIRGLCEPQEWKDVYDFKGFLPKSWKIFPENFFDDTKDNGTEKYDSGTSIVLEEFAKCIVNDTEPPVSAKRALNWTAAGILSEESINKGGIPIDIPDFGL